MIPNNETRRVDAKGRLTLDARFANRLVFLREIDETEVMVTMARAIPEREMWLYRNPAAKAALLEGLEEARQGKFAKNPPDLAADAVLLAAMEKKIARAAARKENKKITGKVATKSEKPGRRATVEA